MDFECPKYIVSDTQQLIFIVRLTTVAPLLDKIGIVGSSNNLNDPPTGYNLLAL